MISQKKHTYAILVVFDYIICFHLEYSSQTRNQDKPEAIQKTSKYTVKRDWREHIAKNRIT